MKGHQVLRTEEEVDLLCAKRVLFGLEIDAVEDEIQVVAVGLDLGMMDFRERVLDGQLVEMEDVGEDFRVGLGGFARDPPTPRFRCRA